MTNIRENQIRNLNIQTFVTATFIGTTILSIILLLNEKSYLETGRYPIKKRTAHDISLFARSLDLFLIIILLYINYNNRNYVKTKKELNNKNLQITASMFSVISAIIVVYVIFNSNELVSLSDVENPLV